MSDGGAIFMQSPFAETADVWKRIPEYHKQTGRQKRLRVYFTDMVKIAREVASARRPGSCEIHRPGRDSDAARIQLYRAGNSRVHH